LGKIEDAVRRLEELHIPYELVRCKPAETMEMLTEIGLEQKGIIGKNLFLRDAKGLRHFLVFVYGDKKVDLAALKEKIGSTRLSFGSAERLESHLGLLKGSVSPLGVLYNLDADVEIVFDRDFIGCPSVGVHPNDNTGVVWLSFEDLVRFVEANGNPISYINL